VAWLSGSLIVLLVTIVLIWDLRRIPRFHTRIRACVCYTPVSTILIGSSQSAIAGVTLVVLQRCMPLDVSESFRNR
jgi:hypothetical protein